MPNLSKPLKTMEDKMSKIPTQINYELDKSWSEIAQNTKP